MTSIASDHDAVIELIIEEYGRLQRHDIKHELLRYIRPVGGETINYCTGERVREDFLQRFSPTEGAPVTAVLGRYLVALMGAVDVIEGIDRKVKPRSKPEIEPADLESCDEIPF